MILQKIQRLTAIEIYTLTKEHLLEQKERSLYHLPSLWGHSQDTCGYRSSEDAGKVLSCAIGFRIPDVLYTEDLEEQGIIDLIQKSPEFAWLLPTDLTEPLGGEFLESLQNLHDIVPVKHWPQALKKFADSWFEGSIIKVTEPDQIPNFYDIYQF